MNAKEMSHMICKALDEKKAGDIKVINIEEVSVMADYFIIASGTNRNQVQAMADNCLLYTSLKPELVMEAFANYLGITLTEFALEINREELYAEGMVSLEDLGEEIGA